MNTRAILRALAVHLLTLVAPAFGQPTPSPPLNPLAKVMEEIQTKGRQAAAANPEQFKATAAAIANQHHELIIQATTSQVANERRLAAILLAFASPSHSGTERLVALADDKVPDVRYAALGALATVTDGTNEPANTAVIRALSESGNSSLTRDAAFAASTLKLADALPLLKQLLEGDDSLNKRYAAEAAARYGPMAATLLPALRQGVATTKEPELKDLMERALASVDRPADANVVPSTASSHPTTKPSLSVASTRTKPKSVPEAAKTESKNENAWPSVLTIGLTVVVGLIAWRILLIRRNHKQ